MPPNASHIMPTYSRADLAFTEGQGSWLITDNGDRYLDFGSGIATCALGHAHPHLAAAIAEQAGRLMHVSNLYRIPGAERLADRLCAATGFDAAFFCNSGAEANEGMIKMARRAQSQAGHPERFRTICFDGAFHGRTLAMISATGNPKYLDGFGPAVDGFDHVPFGNLNALRDAITPATGAILLEPIQGEGGVRAADADFLRGLRAACDEFGLILCLDEVQTGMGRTGSLLACQGMGITPDIVSLAKGIAGGFPMGAILARAAIAANMTPGTHASTFGGNPLAAAAANAVLDVILADGFLDHVRARGEQLRAGLHHLVAANPAVLAGVRGRGLLLGLACTIPNTDLQRAALAAGLITVPAGMNVLRLLPPLTVSAQECETALARLTQAVHHLSAKEEAAQ